VDYESKRIARAYRVQQQSRQQGVIYHLPEPVAMMRDLTLRVLGPQRLQQRFDWLYAPEET
jgi:salicylate hydroxylase